MIGRHVLKHKGLIVRIREYLLVKRIQQEPKLWHTCLQEQVQKHPLPWIITDSHGFLIVASDGALVYNCPDYRRAKLIVRAANYFSG